MIAISNAISIGLNRLGGGGPGPGPDPDAQAYFDRVTSAGGTLTTTEQNAVNQLVIDMKANGTWTPMKAIYPMVGSSAAACAQNLKSASFTGTFTSGWTFASTGATPNGTSAFMDTNLLPSGNLTNNSTHLSYYSKTEQNGVSSTNVDIGVSGLISSNYLPIAFFRSRTSNLFDNGLYNYSGTTFLATVNNSSLGFFVTNRTSNILLNSWKNGSKQGTNTNTETQNITTITRNFYLSALNLDGLASQFSNRQCAFASIGDGLTDTQASDFYTAVQTFNQTLNRQVGAQIVSDADAQAYINRVYTAGGTLTNTEANAVNQLTIDMKAAGIWTPMKAIYPMVGASAAACAQNLKSSSFTGSFSSGWTFASTGVTPNGTSAYMETGFNVLSNFSNYNFHMSIYNRTQSSGNIIDIGAGFAPGTNFQNEIWRTVGAISRATNTMQLIDSERLIYNYTGTPNIQAFYLWNTPSQSKQTIFRNNSKLIEQTTTATTATIPNTNVYVGCFYNAGVTLLFSDRQNAFSSIGDSLTDTQASDFYTAVQAFQTTIGRAIAP